ncbi:MAG: hypothetical protein ACTSYU_10470 [Promethearchaeota archaeon]
MGKISEKIDRNHLIGIILIGFFFFLFSSPIFNDFDLKTNEIGTLQKGKSNYEAVSATSDNITVNFDLLNMELADSFIYGKSDYERIQDLKYFNNTETGKRDLYILLRSQNTSSYWVAEILYFEITDDELILKDNFLISNETSDVFCFTMKLLDVDNNGQPKLFVSGMVDFRGWSFLKVFNIVDSSIQFLWDSWWYSSYGTGRVADVDFYYADFDGDGTLELLTFTSTESSWENHENKIAFWTIESSSLNLENVYDFHSGYLDCSGDYYDIISFANLDSDPQLEICIFLAHGTSSTSDSLEFYIMSYDETSFIEKANFSWQQSIYGYRNLNTIIDDLDDDGTLEIVATYAYVPGSNNFNPQYKVFSYNDSIITVDFENDYTYQFSIAQQQGYWEKIQFNDQIQGEFLSTDNFEGNHTLFLRHWVYDEDQLINIQSIGIFNDCNRPAKFLAIAESSDLGKLILPYEQIDGDGFVLNLQFYNIQIEEPIIPDEDEDGYRTLKTNLGYPKGLWIQNDSIFFTETADRNTIFDGNLTLCEYDLITGQYQLLVDHPMCSDTVVVAQNGTIYLSSYYYSSPGENGKFSTVDPSTNIETVLFDIEIATKDMYIDSNDDIYLLGSSDLSDAKSIYYFPAGDYYNPQILKTGLGRVWSISKQGDYIYFANHTSINRFHLSGGSIEVFLEKSGVLSMTMDDQYIYYADNFGGTIGKISISNGTDETILSDLNRPSQVRYDGFDMLYFLESGTGENEYSDGTLKVYSFSGNYIPPSDEPTDDEPTDDEPIDDEPIDDEPIDDEPIDDEPTDDEPIDDGFKGIPGYSLIVVLGCFVSLITVNRRKIMSKIKN